MKTSDNKYHITMRVGKAEKSVTNKYSEAAVDLLRAVHKGEKFEFDTTRNPSQRSPSKGSRGAGVQISKK